MRATVTSSIPPFSTAPLSSAVTACAGEAACSAITVLAFPHPLKNDCVEATVPRGQTLREIIGRDDLPAVIFADGSIIERERWDTFVPTRRVAIRRVPEGDAGRILGTIAVIALSAWTAGAVGAVYGTAWGAAAGAAAGIVGNLALNALIPPPMPDTGSTGAIEQLNAITGTSNQVAPFRPIPRPYGRVRYFPPIPMTALPYTELVGNDQYFRGLFCLGYGPLDIGGVSTADGLIEDNATVADVIRIGDTPLSSFDDVEYQIGAPADCDLFTDSIVEQQVQQPMPIQSDEHDWGSGGITVPDNLSIIRTTDPDTDEASIDVHFPALFTVNSKGRTRMARVTFRIEYRESGSSGAYTTVSQPFVSSRQRKPIRRGWRWRFPSAGQWEVRFTRVSTYIEDEESVVADCAWTVLRSIKRDVTPFAVPGTVCLAVRIRATDQLTGRLDQVSVETTSILPVWDGDDWTDEPTRNPAWIYADVLTGSATRTPIEKSRVDTAALLDWAEWCEDEGLYCDIVMDAEGTVFDRARDVASAGLGSWHVTDDGSVSVVREQASTPRMLVSPRNSFDFGSEYQYTELPHALRVQFTDPDTWQQTERIVYADGYNESTATRFESLPLIGVTDPDQAWKMGRFHLAQLTLRPETYHWGQDIQHLVYTRGDTVDLANDNILVGLQWGRIKSVATNGLSAVLDELLLMEPSTDYALKVQRSDGTIDTYPIENDTPGTNEVTFLSAIDAEAGDGFVFGELDAETIEVKITRIEPQGDFKARITAVPAAENIFDAWDGEIPAFDPVITDPVDITRLPVPVPEIVDVQSDESVLYRDADGSLAVRMVVQTSVPAFVGWAGTVQVRYRPLEDTTAWNVLPATDQDVHSITDVEEGITYAIQARSVRGSTGIFSAWTAPVVHQVVGKSSPPGDVPSFTARAARDRIELSWTAPDDPDLSHYEIREGASWDTGEFVASVQGTSHQTRAPSNGPWWIKAFDTSGNESVNAVSASITVVLPVVSNVTAQVIDNNVLLRWSWTIGTFDLDSFEIRKGTTLETATVQGRADVTFFTLFEILAGVYTYWIVPIDAAGNEGTASSVTTQVDEPPDFTLHESWQTDWEGYAVSNLVPLLSVPLPARLTTQDTSALEFDGVDDVVQVPHDAALNPAEITIEALIYPTAGVSGNIVSKDFNDGYRFRRNTDGTLTFFDRGATNSLQGSIVVPEGRFSHVAVVADENGISLYVNGELDAQGGSAYGAAAASGDLLIGAGRLTSTTESFAGRIAEVRIWGAARTQEQIQDWMSRTLSGDEEDLVGYWRAMNNVQNTLPDKSGTGHDGAVSGASIYRPTVQALIPFPLEETVEDRETVHGYESPQDQIDDGFPYVAQPVPTTASFEEIYDAGTVIPSTKIGVTLGEQAVTGSVTSTITISTRETLSDPWTDHDPGNEVFATNFRYVKVLVEYVSDGSAFLTAQEIDTQLKAKVKNDAGTVSVGANPTAVSFNVDFIDVQSITVTPLGTVARHAVVDFEDVPNPEGFEVHLFDAAGNAATGSVSWAARGF